MDLKAKVKDRRMVSSCTVCPRCEVRVGSTGVGIMRRSRGGRGATFASSSASSSFRSQRGPVHSLSRRCVVRTRAQPDQNQHDDPQGHNGAFIERRSGGGVLRRRGLSLAGLSLSLAAANTLRPTTCGLKLGAALAEDLESAVLATETQIETRTETPAMGESSSVTTTTSTAETNTLSSSSSSSSSSSTSSSRVFLDIQVDNESFGTVVVELDSDKAPNGAKRFLQLATGELSCMKLPNALLTGTKFDYIDEFSLRNSGPTQTRLKATSFKCDEQLDPATKASVRTLLEKELDAQMAGRGRSHLDEAAAVVSILVRDISDETPAPAKLISKNGKLEFVEDTPRAELMPSAPSGTAFQISVADRSVAENVPGGVAQLRTLDQTHLIVGRVVEGLDVIQKLKGLPYNPNNENNAFFKAGKNAGDKRALVAAKGKLTGGWRHGRKRKRKI